MICIDPSVAMPPFEQIKAQITQARSSGALAAGHRLAPVRSLAAELGLAPNTVARAYRELEALGIIETRGRRGSYITGRTDQLDSAEIAAETYAATIRSLGIAPEVAVRMVAVAMGI